MAELTELSARCKRKEQLERQLHALQEEDRAAQEALLDSQVRCQKENLDIRKFEGNDVKQFWFKLRGQYEQRVLENNERATAAMRQLNDAKSHAFDIDQELKRVEAQLEEMDGAEEAYEEALRERIEQLNYSIHREEIIRRQEKISYDDYQLGLLKDACNICEFAMRRLEMLDALMADLIALTPGENDEDMHLQVQFISAVSELRVLLHQLDALISDIDALETETMQFTSTLAIDTLALFFNKASEKLQSTVFEKNLAQLSVVRNALSNGQGIFQRLIEDVAKNKVLHQTQLETFIRETIV